MPLFLLSLSNRSQRETSPNIIWLLPFIFTCLIQTRDYIRKQKWLLEIEWALSAFLEISVSSMMDWVRRRRLVWNLFRKVVIVGFKVVFLVNFVSNLVSTALMHYLHCFEFRVEVLVSKPVYILSFLSVVENHCLKTYGNISNFDSIVIEVKITKLEHFPTFCFLFLLFFCDLLWLLYLYIDIVFSSAALLDIV